MTFGSEDAGYVLEIDDDGKGFDVGAATAGMGLRNLEERVVALGGSFEVRSVAGEGTTVRATFAP